MSSGCKTSNGDRETLQFLYEQNQASSFFTWEWVMVSSSNLVDIASLTSGSKLWEIMVLYVMYPHKPFQATQGCAFDARNYPYLYNVTWDVPKRT
jgi:hypothetical protein